MSNTVSLIQSPGGRIEVGAPFTLNDKRYVEVTAFPDTGYKFVRFDVTTTLFSPPPPTEEPGSPEDSLSPRPGSGDTELI